MQLSPICAKEITAPALITELFQLCLPDELLQMGGLLHYRQ